MQNEELAKALLGAVENGFKKEREKHDPERLKKGKECIERMRKFRDKNKEQQSPESKGEEHY
jgi:hypothetical protein